jgi:hypothetical protein
MKTSVWILTLLLMTFNLSHAQDEEEKAWFDFWVGKWEVTWTGADGKVGKATNSITKILDEVVISENFIIRDGTQKGYKGTSLSVYNPMRKQWHQAYADNQGAYFNFVGERDGEKKIFRTEPVVSGDKKIIQRMVFYDIKKDSLMWDWEKSEDGGKTWKLNWQLKYTRIPE